MSEADVIAEFEASLPADMPEDHKAARVAQAVENFRAAQAAAEAPKPPEPETEE